MGSVGEAPPGGPNVQMIGWNVLLHPRSMASPLANGAANRATTAGSVATVSAPARFPAAQFDTSALAAASALGCNAVGSACVVVLVRGGATAVVVDFAAAARAGRPGLERGRCTYPRASKLTARTAITIRRAILRGLLNRCGLRCSPPDRPLWPAGCGMTDHCSSPAVARS